ncbi:hypothetical protein ACFL5O_06770 [Myxococcota bacterium]
MDTSNGFGTRFLLRVVDRVDSAALPLWQPILTQLPDGFHLPRDTLPLHTLLLRRW